MAPVGEEEEGRRRGRRRRGAAWGGGGAGAEARATSGKLSDGCDICVINKLCGDQRRRRDTPRTVKKKPRNMAMMIKIEFFRL